MWNPYWRYYSYRFLHLGGFGGVLGPIKAEEYWGEFWKWLTQRYSWEEWESKNPSQRADAVFEFWKEKGELLDKGKV